MKKNSKVFGAVLCSAALAMGMAMPAFAEVKAGGDVETSNPSTISKDGGTAATTVDIFYSATQISVTVPVKIGFGVVSGANTVKDIVTPSPSVYQITNNSPESTIYVSNIKVASLDTSKWVLSDKAAITNTEIGSAKAGALWLTLAANGITHADATASTPVNTNVLTSSSAQTDGWSNTAGENTTLQAAKAGGTIGIDLAGKSKTASGLSGDGFTPGALSITYTITTNGASLS